MAIQRKRTQTHAPVSCDYYGGRERRLGKALRERNSKNESGGQFPRSPCRGSPPQHHRNPPEQIQRVIVQKEISRAQKNPGWLKKGGRVFVLGGGGRGGPAGGKMGGHGAPAARGIPGNGAAAIGLPSERQPAEGP